MGIDLESKMDDPMLDTLEGVLERGCVQVPSDHLDGGSIVPEWIYDGVLDTGNAEMVVGLLCPEEGGPLRAAMRNGHGVGTAVYRRGAVQQRRVGAFTRLRTKVTAMVVRVCGHGVQVRTFVRARGVCVC